MQSGYTALRDAYVHRDRLVRTSQRNGRKIVGYVCDNVPVELICAAGFLPYRLSGDPGQTRAEIQELVTPTLARRFAGNEFVDAMYAPLAAGKLDFLDYLVVPHNRKAVLAFIQSVEILRQSKPGFKVPETHCLDRTYTRSFLTSGFNQSSIFRFNTAVENWRGAPVTDLELQAAIEQASRSRALLREMNDLRGGSSPRITGTEALHIYGASHFMAPDSFAEAVSAFIAEARRRAPLRGVRVYLGGSPLDHAHLYQAIEEMGAIIVAEDHCWGARCSEATLDPACPPLEALARRFDRQPACSLLGSIDAITSSVVNRATRSGAQVAIFNVIRGDMAQMWETPSQVQALENRGIPCLHLGRQPYSFNDGSTALEQIRAFLTIAPSEAIHG